MSSNLEPILDTGAAGQVGGIGGRSLNGGGAETESSPGSSAYRMKTRAAVSAMVSNPSGTTPAMKSQSRSTLTSWEIGQSLSTTKIKSIARASMGSRSTRTRAKPARDRTAS
jgi:hypothetical protein